MDDQLVQSFNCQTRLPIEIIYMILIYLREPQSAILLKDIFHFSKTMPILTKIYYDRWIVQQQSEEGEDINWLENDLILYANEYAPTLIGIQHKFKQILGRFSNVKKASKFNFHEYSNSNKLSPKTKVNILWGLFTPVERDEFISSSG
jgi:hypothetical protein